MVEKWIVPCNIKYFDLISHFKQKNYVVWKNSFTIKQDDIVYIYIGTPIKEIRFCCKVVSDKVSDAVVQANAYAIPQKSSNNYFSKKEKYILLELLYEYPIGTLTYSDLKQNGLGQVQIQARTDRRLQKYIDEIDVSVRGGK
jgi:5-methylcytosine-specific restriction protein A